MVKLLTTKNQFETMKKILFVALAMMMAIGGRAESEKRNVGEFSGVTLIGSYTVICTQGKDCSVVVEAPKEIAEQLQTEVKKGTLTISKKKIAGVNVISSDKADTEAIVYVTLPKLRNVTLVGTGDIQVKGKIECDEELNVSLSGSGDIEMGDMEVNSSKFSLAGTGDIKVNSVKSAQVEMNLAGTGDMEFKKVDADKTTINIAGSGDMRVGQITASYLMVRMDGSGNLKIAGTAKIYNKMLRGSSNVEDSNLRIGSIPSSQKMGSQSPNGIEAQP